MKQSSEFEKRHYKFGLFYHHKDNPSIWIPKADGLGWTLNFANKWSYAIVALILGLSVFCCFLAFKQKN